MVNNTKGFYKMKETDKVTLTVAQLKKLIAESRQINEAREFDGIKIGNLSKVLNYIDKVKDFAATVADDGWDFYSVLEDAPKDFDKEWERTLKTKKSTFIRGLNRLAPLFDANKIKL